MSYFYQENLTENNEDFEFQYAINRENLEENNFLVNLHYHNGIEILYGIKGDFMVRVGLKTYQFCKGDIVFINSKRLHSVQASSCEIDDCYYVLKISPFLLFGSKNNIFNIDINNSLFLENSEEIVLNTALELEKYNIEQLINKLKNECTNKNLPYHNEAIKIYLNELILCLFRVWSEKDILKYSDDNKEKNDDFIRVIEYINNHYTEDLKVHELAKQFCMSRSNFAKIFKKYTSVTFTEYINGLRVSDAVYCLVGTNLTVTEIAFKLGFVSTSYFIETFKKFKGVAPLQFRKKHMESKKKN